MAVHSVLGVFAHPDDESLAAGGLLARQAAAGARVTVVTATWAAGTVRAAELGEAVRMLGADEPRLLGYADARVPASAPGSRRWCEAPLEETLRRLVAQIRELRPAVVLTHDTCGGLTGHPDHRHTYRVTAMAVEAAALGQLYPDEGDPWQPEALYLATHPHSALAMLRGVIGERRAVHTVPDTEVALTLDVTPWLQHKLAAVLAHRTEVERGALPGLVSALPPAVRDELLGTEWYAVRHLRPDPTGSS